MDTFAAQVVYEHFTDSSSKTTTTTKSKSLSTGAIIGWILYAIFTVAIGSWAAYLSWKANTLAEWGTGWKVLFSFFAFFCGFSYLFTYLIHKYDLVIVINKLRPTQIPMQ